MTIQKFFFALNIHKYFTPHLPFADYFLYFALLLFFCRPGNSVATTFNVSKSLQIQRRENAFTGSVHVAQCQSLVQSPLPGWHQYTALVSGPRRRKASHVALYLRLLGCYKSHHVQRWSERQDFVLLPRTAMHRYANQHGRGFCELSTDRQSMIGCCYFYR